MTDRRPAALSATEVLSAYATRTLSPVEVLRDVAEIVSTQEATLNALWVNDLETRPDDLLDDALASDVRWPPARPWAPLTASPSPSRRTSPGPGCRCPRAAPG